MELRARLPVFTEALALLLVFIAFVTIQVLIGGTRMVFSLPAYLIAGVAGIVAMISLRRPKPSPCRVCLLVTTLAFAYLLGRALLSPTPYIARSDIYCALAALVVYFAFALVLTNPLARMVFVLGLLLFAIVHVLIGAVQFRDGNNFMPIAWLQRYDYGTRASGFYVCPNHLAGFLEVVGVFGLSIACWSRWPIWAKLLIGYLAGVCYVGLIITGSRGGNLSAGASLIVFVGLSLVALRSTTPRFFWQVTAIGTAAALVIVVVAGLAVTRSHYLTTRAATVIEPKNVRRELWDAALRQWNVAPVIGTGSGTYMYYGRFFRNPGMQRDPVFVHNDYLHLLAEYGLLGGAAMAAVIAFHLRHGFRSFARLGPKRVAASQRLFSNGLALNIGALSSVAAYAVHEALDFNLHIPANALLMAFVFGVLANYGLVREREATSVSRLDLVPRLGLGALAVLLICASARLFPGELFSERARMAVRDNRPAFAIVNATRGLKYDPQNPDLYYRLGEARMAIGDTIGDPIAAKSFYNDAAEALSTARSIAPQDETYAIELASALDSAERFSEAEWIFYEAMQLDPRSDSLPR
ncbi:MAG: O-antigen ligase family protein, partial [Chthoniobacterales bacterium]